MAKKTLKDDLAEARSSAKYWKDRAEKDGEAIREARIEIIAVNRTVDALKTSLFEIEKIKGDYERKMFEIVRWHVNPETAKFPFRAEKDQRDDRSYGSFVPY